MADNRYGRDNDWRGRDERDRMDRGQDFGRSGMDRDRDDDRNFSGAHRGNSSYFEESYGEQERGGRHRDDDRSRFFGIGHSRDDRGDYQASQDRGRSSMSSYSAGSQRFGRDDDRGYEDRSRYAGGMSGGGYGGGMSRDQDRSMSGMMGSDDDNRRFDRPMGDGGMSGSQGGGYGGRSRYGQGSTTGSFGQSSYGSGQSDLGAPQGGYQGFAPGSSSGQPPRDEHYLSLRERHLAEFDRQYDEFRRHQQDRHAAEFEEWRRTRSQSDPARQVREHMEVVGSDDGHVGIIDNVEGNRIKLARTDAAAGGQHHYIDASLVRSVEGNRVKLSQSADEAKRAWQAEPGQTAGTGGSSFGGAGTATGTSTAAGTSGVGTSGSSTDTSDSASSRSTRK